MDVGLDERKTEALVRILNTLLADEVTLYQKTRNYHWNVVGPHFHSLHELFEKQYTELAEIGDEAAEWTRMLGGKATGTLQEYGRMTRLQEQPGSYPPADEMLRNLTQDHQTIIKSLRDEIDRAAEELKAADVADFLTGVMEQHEKMAWMLRAHCEQP
jgi:starvation-inducible DNA-binding protein